MVEKIYGIFLLKKFTEKNYGKKLRKKFPAKFDIRRKLWYNIGRK